MDKDNEIYVTSNGELYKKGVEQAVYPQTNYTTQQFYTKEEYERLQAENERLKAGNKELSESIKRLKNMAKAAALGREKYKYALLEIKDIVSEPCIVDENCQTCKSNCMQKDILAKINEVIGAEE